MWFDGKSPLFALKKEWFDRYANSPSKVRVVHVVLFIAVMWRGVNEPTPEAPFFIQQKKKKEQRKGETQSCSDSCMFL